MKIEAGKAYLTGSGVKVRVLCADRNHTDYPVVGMSDDGQLMEYTATGGYYSDGIGSNLDLVREAPETVTLHLYRDNSGNVYALGHRHDGYIKTIEVEL